MNCTDKIRKILVKTSYLLIAIIFWLLVWFFCARKINNKIFLPTPKETIHEMFRLFGDKNFWKIVTASFGRIIKGFFIALIAGIVLGTISYFIKLFRILLEPAMRLLKAVPVASFTILALLWLDSEKLATLVAAMMVLPVIYVNMLAAFDSIDKKMLEMAKVFKMPVNKKIRFIYIPGVMPGLVAGCKLGLGFCFKAGIAAEIIGTPMNSIGWELYQSKLYLETETLFAWTLIIVIMSGCFEGIFIILMKWLTSRGTCFNIRTVGESEIKESLHSIDDEGSTVTTMSSPQRKNSVESQIQKSVSPSISPKAVLKNLSKAYGKNQVLKDVNMKFEKGKLYCITGESGAGKTTLARILLQLEKQDSGEMVLEGINRKAAVFQEDRLIEEADGFANIYAVTKGKIEVNKVNEFVDRLGLELEAAGNKVSKMSGGMKRRLAVIRAFYDSPELVVLDEPFNGLDEDNRQKLMKFIKENKKDKIIILITHHYEEVEEIVDFHYIFTK